MIDEKLLKKATESVVEGDKELAVQLAREGLEAGVDPAEFIERGFVPGIVRIGELFEDGEIFLPELIMAADTIKGAVDILNDAMAAAGQKREATAKVVLATVEADLHDIGKGIVASLMVANGFEVIDLGRDVQSRKIIDKAIEIGADVIGSSALLTTTMTHQQEIEDILKQEGLKGSIRTIIGGAPVTERWRAKIGADGFGENAADSVRLVNEFMREKNKQTN
jgi:trimethylamine corrinoid protein